MSTRAYHVQHVFGFLICRLFQSALSMAKGRTRSCAAKKASNTNSEGRKSIKNEENEEEFDQEEPLTVKSKVKSDSSSKKLEEKEKGKPRGKEKGPKSKIKKNGHLPKEESDFESDDLSVLDQPSTSKGITRKKSKVPSKAATAEKTSNTKREPSENDEDSEESEDWEEVEDAQVEDEDDLENYKPQLPEEGVQITLDTPQFTSKRRKKKKVDVNDLLRQQLNKMKKELQLEIHKTHLLSLLSRGFYLNNLTYNRNLMALALSYLTDFSFDLKDVRLLFVKNFTDWFRNWFKLTPKTRSKVNLVDSLTQAFQTRVVPGAVEYALMFLIFLRTYSPRIHCRLCYALNPIPIKPDNLILSEKQRSRSKPSKIDASASEHEKAKGSSSETKSSKSNQKVSFCKNLDDSSNSSNFLEIVEEDIVKKPKRGRKRKNLNEGCVDDKTEEESKKPKKKIKKVPQKMISSDEEELQVIDSSESEERLEYWIEIYVDTEEKWICLDPSNGIEDKPKAIEKLTHIPLLYVVSFDNFNHVKDVTQRYASDFGSCKFRRQRIDEVWWNDSLAFFRPKRRTKREKKEDEDLSEEFARRPMPASLSDFKNHPLYILKKHLLKYEVIYPPDAIPIGYFRGEPVYARECVKDVHSKDYWMRQARVVRVDEEPYKIGIKKKKWDKNLGDYLHDLPQELFGEWQTNPYVPPVAKDGKVPRNKFGNVELFQPCMLPIGCVHLKLPGLARIANKLKIDCVPAVVGFDQSHSGAHPVVEGYVVCEEFEEILTAAWEEEQENAKVREKARREKRVYGNWKRLIKGVLIREHLKAKYKNDDEQINPLVSVTDEDY